LIRNCTLIAGGLALAAALAACEPSPGPASELTYAPAVAQHLVAARSDPDKALADKVRQALGLEAGTMAHGVEVTAGGGTVQLWGSAASVAERTRSR
jgi:osmotically-inducible protein OsmY